LKTLKPTPYENKNNLEYYVLQMIKQRYHDQKIYFRKQWLLKQKKKQGLSFWREGFK
jgi:hypothetical protein